MHRRVRGFVCQTVFAVRYVKGSISINPDKICSGSFRGIFVFCFFFPNPHIILLFMLIPTLSPSQKRCFPAGPDGCEPQRCDKQLQRLFYGVAWKRGSTAQVTCRLANRFAECRFERSRSEILGSEPTPGQMQRYNWRTAGVVSTGRAGRTSSRRSPSP